MGGSKPKEPTVTQVPTKSPQQTQFLESLLSFFPEAMAGQTIGGAYGGPGQANYSPITVGGGKGGSAPRGGMPGSGRKRGSPLDAALTNPIVGPFREGMTGNYPRRRR